MFQLDRKNSSEVFFCVRRGDLLKMSQHSGLFLLGKYAESTLEAKLLQLPLISSLSLPESRLLCVRAAAGEHGGAQSPRAPWCSGSAGGRGRRVVWKGQGHGAVTATPTAC